jgi:superfamily II DNA or RNA helicase
MGGSLSSREISDLKGAGAKMQAELRPYQVEALAAVRQSIGQGVRRIMLQAATGAGKTKIAAAIVGDEIQ